MSSHPHFINSGVKYYKRKIEIINAVISTTALNNTARLFEKMYPEAVILIIYLSYVDDLMGGTSTRERVPKLIEEIEEIAAMGGFRYKKFIIGGDNHEEINLMSSEQEVCGKVLGVGWDPKLD